MCLLRPRASPGFSAELEIKQKLPFVCTDICCVNVFTVQEVSEVMEQQRHLMKCVLDDSRLNKLRLEGGTVLARIRKEEICENESYR